MIEGAKEEGERNKATDVAKKLIKSGVDVDIIASSTGLTKAEVERLIKHHKV